MRWSGRPEPGQSVVQVVELVPRAAPAAVPLPPGPAGPATAAGAADRVETAVAAAYTEGTRSLHFLAPRAVGRDCASRILAAHLPEGGYNAFRADVLAAQLPDGCRLLIAREGSVCVYVLEGASHTSPWPG